MKTRITSHAKHGATVYLVWYLPVGSEVFQTYSSCDTMKEARDDVRRIRNGEVSL